MRIIDPVDIAPDQEEIVRLLRGKTSDREPDARTLELIGDALRKAATLAHPRGVYTILDRGQVSDHPAFASAERVGLCISTIGPELEARVGDLMKAGELARGVVLDAVGSEMAEATARALDLGMESDEARGAHLAGARFSPGYGGWEIEGQNLLFRLLDAGRIGVRLSTSLMMVPRKSVSFAMNFGPDPQPPRCSSVCGRCEMRNCAFRRE